MRLTPGPKLTEEGNVIVSNWECAFLIGSVHLVSG